MRVYLGLFLTQRDGEGCFLGNSAGKPGGWLPLSFTERNNCIASDFSRNHTLRLVNPATGCRAKEPVDVCAIVPGSAALKTAYRRGVANAAEKAWEITGHWEAKKGEPEGSPHSYHLDASSVRRNQLLFHREHLAHIQP